MQDNQQTQGHGCQNGTSCIGVGPEGSTTSSIATAIAFTDVPAGTTPPPASNPFTTSTIGTVATASAQSLLMTKILAAIVSYMFHCIMISYTELL